MPSIDRNKRARLLFQAEALDRRTHQPGQHGGCLKHSGLRVLHALLCTFANTVTGRCDPSYDALARAAGVARSTVAVALARLEAAGLVHRIARWRVVGVNGGLVVLQLSNAYLFPTVGAQKSPEAGSRLQTTNKLFEQPNPAKTGPYPGDPRNVSDRVRALLAVLERRERRLGLTP